MKSAKKFFSLAMVLCIALSLAPMATYAENTGNLLKNGGFETVETRTTGEGEDAVEYLWPAKVNGKEVWYANPTSGGAYSRTVEGTEVLLTSEEVHSGSYALKVVPHASNKRRITQWVEGLTPGIWYEASVWVMISGDNVSGNSGYGADLLAGNERGASYGKSYWWATATNDCNSARTIKTTYNKWTKMTARWQQPAEKTHVVIAFEMGVATSNSVYYFDDAVVQEFAGFDGSFETVTTEKLSDTETVLWPADVAIFNYTNQLGAFAGEVSAAKDLVHSGTYALKMVSGTASSRRATLFVPDLTAGKTYKVKAYMQITTTLSGAASIHVGPSYVTAGGDMWGKSSDYKAATTEWKEVSVAFTVPEGYNYAVINLNSGTVAEGSSAAVYFDDVTIEETNVCFTTTDGAILGEPLSAPGTVNAKATVIGAEGDTARMLVGVYETVAGTTRLANVYVSDSITLTSAKWDDIIVENISLSAGQYAKAILLDGAAGLVPLIEAVTLSVSAS